MSTIYNNPDKIQAGDIVILNRKEPAECEGGIFVEPFTRLRIRSVSLKYNFAMLETEHDKIALIDPALLPIYGMQNLGRIQKVDKWIESVKAEYDLAQKRSRIFGKLNYKMLLFLSTILTFLIVFGFYSMIHQIFLFEKTEVFIIASVIFGVIVYFSATAIGNKIYTMSAAQRQVAEAEKSLKLYQQANPTMETHDSFRQRLTGSNR